MGSSEMPLCWGAGSVVMPAQTELSGLGRCAGSDGGDFYGPGSYVRPCRAS